MNPDTQSNRETTECTTIQESRSSRFNLPVRHPSRWQLLFENILSSPMRLHAYRDLSRRIVEDAISVDDCWSCK